MKTFLESIITSVLLIALVAFLGGTIVWWLWPLSIPVVFPGLVTSGALTATLPWKAAVALTWLFTILLKGISTK